jgi:hypothetical protein
MLYKLLASAEAFEAKILVFLGNIGVYRIFLPKIGFSYLQFFICFANMAPILFVKNSLKEAVCV